jgi:ABC-2 type transport system permease protein
MRNIWLVVKHDVGAMLRQRSFWIFTLLVPALLLVLNGYRVITDDSRGGAGNATAGQASADTSPQGLQAIGLVDEAGLIAEMPPGFPPSLFVRFADEVSARAALEAGQVPQYVSISADYVTSGQIDVYDKDYQILSSGQNMGVAFGSEYEWVLPYVINYNLVDDEKMLVALRNPVPGTLAELHALRPPAGGGAESQQLAELVSTVLPYVYYFLLVMGSNYLLRSVAAEKENRTAELLLLSLDPRELMVGKMAAMSVVLWLQVMVWVGGGILILNRGADMLNVTRFTFPTGFVIWALLFLILGYLLFASVTAAAGAIAPNAREAGQVTWLLILPLMPTLMFGSAFLEDPNGTLSVVLSLFPFSAPSAMVTRLAVAEVPLWQILVSLGGLALTVYLFLSISARFFRSSNLLSYDSFNLKRLAMGWRKTGL